MQIQYELLNVVKANIWKLYMKFEANKEFMENLSLHRCLRTPETPKQLSRLQTQLTSLALVEQKYGLLASSSSIQVRDWEN